MIVSRFYLDISTRLRTILDEQGAPKIKHLDLWNHQIEEDEDSEGLGFPTPAVFLELLPSPAITLGRRKQLCEQAFLLHVVSEIFGEHSSRETVAIRQRALSHLSLLDDIFKSLQNFSGEYFNSINRTDAPLFDHQHSQVYSHTLSFKTLITDVAAARTFLHIEPALIVTPKSTS